MSPTPNPAALDRLAHELGLPAPFPALPAYAAVAERIAAQAADGPLVAGICGPQGSGKSTMAAFVALLLRDRGLPTAILSLDDLYLDPEDRPTHIHPLFATRGVPGTHDVALGLDTIDRLIAGGADTITPLPRFDKAHDRRGQPEPFAGPARVVLFEGWCVGATPQPAEALADPVNALERDEDSAGTWRTHVNAQLAGPYAGLFARIGFLAYLRAPSFDCVFRWRRLQEDKLRARVGTESPGLMDEPALHRFIMHYERLTRHLIETLPPRADALLTLDEHQAITALR